MIGINQRIPICILEMAIIAAIHGDDSPEYFASLASTEYNGENRIKKAVSVINRLCVKNSLWPFVKENGTKMEAALKSKTDRPVVIAALICSAYSFGFDAVSIAGKYFHAQDEVRSTMIQEQLGYKYGANRSLPNAFNSVIPMLLDAGFMERPVTGVLKIHRHSMVGEFAFELYKQAFLQNNKGLCEDDDFSEHPFFEFIEY